MLAIVLEIDLNIITFKEELFIQINNVHLSDFPNDYATFGT